MLFKNIIRIITLICAVCSLAMFARAEDYEKSLVLNSYDLLPRSLISNDYYRIDQTVLNQGYLNKFHIRSNFGDQLVLGSSMLAIRINELKALHALSKISSAKVIKDSALDNGEKILTAPIKVSKKVIGLVEDPNKIVTTAQSIPDGIEQIFSWGARQLHGGLEYANKQMNKSDTKDSKDSQDSDTGSKAVNFAKKSGLKYIKYTSAEREWFKKLGVDQYTDNEQLQDEVQRVSGIQTAMNFGFKFVPGFNLGLIGEVNKWYSRAEDLGMYEPYDILFDKNESKLALMNIDKKTQNKLFSNKNIWPSMQTVLVDCLDQLKTANPKIQNLGKFVEVAATSSSPEAALYYVESCSLLNKIRDKKFNFVKIITSDLVPAAVASNKELVIPVAIDYLLWTKDVHMAFQKIRGLYYKTLSNQSITVALKGRVSDLAKARFKSLGVKLIEYKN